MEDKKTWKIRPVPTFIAEKFCKSAGALFSVFLMKANSLIFISLISSTGSLSCTLDDLRSSAGGSTLGVNLIPFASLRGDASSAADEVRSWKSEAEIDTNTLKNQKESKLYDIKQLKEKIANEEKVEETLRRNDDIEKWNKEIEDNNTKISEINEKMTRGLEAIDKLAEAREKLRGYFDTAKSQLSDLKSNPERVLGSKPSSGDEEKLREYEENVKKLEEYIRVILGEIEDEEKGHRQAEDELKTSRDKLKEVLAKTE